MSDDEGLRELLSVGLVSAIVFDFYVQVQWALAAVHFLAALIRTNEWALNFFGSAPVMLLSVAFLRRLLNWLLRLQFELLLALDSMLNLPEGRSLLFGKSELAELHLFFGRLVTLLIAWGRILLVAVLDWSVFVVRSWFLEGRCFGLLFIVSYRFFLWRTVSIFGFLRGLLERRRLQLRLFILLLFLLLALNDPIQVLVREREHFWKQIVLVIIL